MTDKIEKFEDLRVWEEGMNLTVELYNAFKDCRDFGLRDQAQRAADSIPSNIAEGFDRRSNNELIRFLRIAKGSCAERRTQLINSQRVGILKMTI